MALMQMHEHLSRQFPEVCPMEPGRRRRAAAGAAPGPAPSAGIGKGEDGSAEVAKSADLPTAAAAPPVAAVLKAPAEGDLVDDAVYKGFKKMRKKLGKKVLAGKMTVDEARTKMGRQFAQKAAEPTRTAVQKSAAAGRLARPVASADHAARAA